MDSTGRDVRALRIVAGGTLTLLTTFAWASLCCASPASHSSASSLEIAAADVAQAKPHDLQLAWYPYGRGIRGPVYHYSYGPSCGPMVPTTRTMKNNLWQSHQWKGEYPVFQPLYAPNFGHYQTRWRSFPGEDCTPAGPILDVHPF